MKSPRDVDILISKVRGLASYTEDLNLPGTLVCRVLRSQVPHARLKRVNTAHAERQPGVAAVITGKDVQELNHPYLGTGVQDEPILVFDKVRFSGDPLAAVAAVDEKGAEQALELIEVEYEELPSVTTAQEAMQASAPIIHEALGTNFCHSHSFGWGDLKRGFKESELVLEDTFSFPSVFQHPLEPVGVCLATVEGDRVILYVPDQRPLAGQFSLARIFGLDPRKIILRVPYIGGGFGSKYLKREAAMAILLSKKTGQPVMVKPTMDESFATDCRHAYTYSLKTGFKRDGAIAARSVDTVVNVGAYGSAPVNPVRRSAIAGVAPYRIADYNFVARSFYTNTVPAGAFRSIGRPQIIWGCESQLDEAAQQLGMTPVEIRLKNLMERGEKFPVDELPPLDADVKGGLKKLAAVLDEIPLSPPAGPSKKSGRGIASSIRPGGNESMNAAQAFLELGIDGNVRAITAGTEVGQGYEAMVRQVVSKELGLPMERVEVALADTAVAPFFYGTSGTRTTYAMGTAIQEAAKDLKKDLLYIAAKIWRVPEARLEIKSGMIVDTALGGRSISFQDVVRTIGRGARIYGKGTYVSDKGVCAISWEPCFYAVDVEVDTGTGEFEITRCVTVADVGQVLDPRACLGQVEGGTVMALGHSLFEEMLYGEGKLLNGSPLFYRLPRLQDLPLSQETFLIENKDGPGPFGSRGAGNASMNPVAPAIGNAIYRATGARVKELPITSERIYRCLAKKESSG